MKIHLETGAGQNMIRAYGPGLITVNRAEYRASLIVTPRQIVPDWAPRSVAELARAHFVAVIGLAPEVVLLGTGARLRFPDTACTRALLEAKIGLEVMDTGAACRTYNILMAEGRRVAAALLMIEGGDS
ncbi:MAG: hypothetical protein A2V92_04410 [Candidatus Muproteobacteria bacterium RBG_16_65_31]|uniref:Xcc1710-like domain-containing protein n=1 Tax=Candidatus Muproteobacteria bacterium RBG_16_65_31 TaxID=1817759 RepID=A0A1F6TGT4_9PROT|nr:MAG: hypothetical protein A2V92_04410 [Candidatus Muproteobacteria bacterium RBG_16_65_31]